MRPTISIQPLTFDLFIADVLRRAHHAAEAAGAPGEARAILDVAQLFADDLAQTDLPFDRVRFIQAITDDPASSSSAAERPQKVTT